MLVTDWVVSTGTTIVLELHLARLQVQPINPIAWSVTTGNWYSCYNVMESYVVILQVMMIITVGKELPVDLLGFHSSSPLRCLNPIYHSGHTSLSGAA